MIILIRLLSTLLVAALWTFTVTTVASQTVLNNRYVSHQLEATKSYDRLSVAISDEIAHSPSLVAVPNASNTIRSFVTPDVLKTKITTSLEQLQAYYHGDGPEPTVDLTDLAAQAQAAGLPIEQNSSLLRPITLGTERETQLVVHIYDVVHLLALVATVFIGFTLLVLSVWQRRYSVIPTALSVVGVLVGLLAAVIYFTPGLFYHALPAGNIFTLIGNDLATAFARDIGKRLGVIAVVYVVVGVSTLVIAKRLQSKPTIGQDTAKAQD